MGPPTDSLPVNLAAMVSKRSRRRAAGGAWALQGVLGTSSLVFFFALLEEKVIDWQQGGSQALCEVGLDVVVWARC